MKKVIYVLSLLCCAGIASAQFPERINYQAVARDAGGIPLTNQNICLIIKITDGNGGPVLYTENHNLNTNQFGLFATAIGGGDSVAFAAINWTGTSPWLDVSMDIGCTGSYTGMGSSQLLSVPYALNAISSMDNHWVKNGNDLSNNNSGNVGIGTTTPGQKLEVNGWIRTIGVDNNLSSPLSFHSTGGIISDASQHVWYTNSAIQMIITNTGGVGIGTVIPAARLHVASGDIMQETVPGTDWVYIGEGTVGTNNDLTQVSRFVSAIGGTDYWGMGKTLPNGYDFHVSNYSHSRFYDLTIAENSGYVGIGTASPAAQLEVNGQVKINGGNPADGASLISDAFGLASWQKGTIVAISFTSSTTNLQATCTNYAGGVVTITVPGPGTITVEANVRVQLNHTNGTTDRMFLEIDNAASSCNAASFDQAVWLIPSGEPTANFWDNTFTVRRVYTVGASGTYNYYLNGYMGQGYDAADNFWYASMQATYTR